MCDAYLMRDGLSLSPLSLSLLSLCIDLVSKHLENDLALLSRRAAGANPVVVGEFPPPPPIRPQQKTQP